MHFRNVVIGRGKSKYMLPLRVKYHVHFLVVSSLPQNPLVKKRKNLIFQTAKQFFFKRGLQKTNIIAFIKTNNLGRVVTVKNTLVTCFTFFSFLFSFFIGVSCTKVNFWMKIKIFFWNWLPQNPNFHFFPTVHWISILPPRQQINIVQLCVLTYSGGTILDGRSDLLGTQSCARRTQCSPLAIQTFPTHITFRCLDFICNPLY